MVLTLRSWQSITDDKTITLIPQSLMLSLTPVIDTTVTQISHWTRVIVIATLYLDKYSDILD